MGAAPVFLHGHNAEGFIQACRIVEICDDIPDVGLGYFHNAGNKCPAEIWQTAGRLKKNPVSRSLAQGLKPKYLYVRSLRDEMYQKGVPFPQNWRSRS